jgi:hypothetical protein
LLLIAALAFVAQTLLSFAHVHLSGGSRYYAIPGLGACTPNTGKPCDAPRPTHHEGDCPLCAAIHAASTLISPTGPAIVVPLSFERVQASAFVAAARPVQRTFRFQARAPPARII